MTTENNNLVLISGKSTTGKSASLRNIKNPEGVLYLNCENNKKLPFGNIKFSQYNVTDPLKVFAIFKKAEENDKIHTIVIDSLTYLMDMFESTKVITAADSRSAWGDYAQFLKKLMFVYVAESTKNVIFLAHTSEIENSEDPFKNEVCVKVKGSLMNTGIESYFSTVISTKKVDISELEGYKSDLLTITEDEKEDEYKYVFQTRLTKKTVNERIRGPMGMWSRAETFIDNDIQNVIDKLHTYYK